jgi:hypothetical protein
MVWLIFLNSPGEMKAKPLGTPGRTAASAAAAGFAFPNIPNHTEYDNSEGDKNNGPNYNNIHKNLCQ